MDTEKKKLSTGQRKENISRMLASTAVFTLLSSTEIQQQQVQSEAAHSFDWQASDVKW